MQKQTYSIGANKIEVLSNGDQFVGLGACWIGDKKVRSGRLPIRAFTQAFSGHELKGLKLLGVDATAKKIRVKVEASFALMPVKPMRDHSFDPIHETSDWDNPEAASAKGRLDLVIVPAKDSFNGVDFAGFSYHYEWKSNDVSIYYLYDQASWELDGNIEGATAVSQSSCSPPTAKFKKDTKWSTEGILYFLVDGGQNPVMTHNLPRWASHGDFDFQYKGSDTLVGVFERVELIRSILQRDANKAELKCFDKHIFDDTKSFTTSAKKIMLNSAPKTETAQKNLWSWMFEDIHDRARKEYGVKETPTYPYLFQNFWNNFTVDSYYKDLLPAAKAIGARKYFVDNLKKSSMTAKCPNPPAVAWNMCCGHEFEIAPELGGVKRVKDFVEESHKNGVKTMIWTNNDQALSSPINDTERDDKGWFVLMEDARSKWGGAYLSVMSVLDMGVDAARDYFVKSHIKIKEETGCDAFFFDSFYNLGFMPVTFRNMKPRTMWKGLLKAFAQLRNAGIEMNIESFGPWGAVTHGHPSSYDIPNIFVCYKVGVGNDYSTVPTGHPLKNISPTEPEGAYYSLAHMAGCHMPLHEKGKRIDEWWTKQHIQALADYHAALPKLKRRYLQEDNKAVVWHDAKKSVATIFNFADRKMALPGKVKDLTTGKDLPKSGKYKLEALHTYVVSGAALPTAVG